MPDIRELRYFAAVYEDRSVTAAARRCFVSQPSVSAAITGLERELGAPLFVRHRKGAVPTPAAEQLYPIARRLVDETRALGSLFRTAPRPRRLVLGLMRALDLERALAIVEPLTQRADLKITLVGADERCDARVIAKSLARPGETFLPLWEERYVVALPASHPLALRPRLAPSDLAGTKLIERRYCESAKFSAASIGMGRVRRHGGMGARAGRRGCRDRDRAGGLGPSRSARRNPPTHTRHRGAPCRARVRVARAAAARVARARRWDRAGSLAQAPRTRMIATRYDR